MARLLPYPDGLPVIGREPLAGPRIVGSSATQSIGGFVQTNASPFGLWRWRFVMKSMRGQLARRYRGWITSLHGGANASRVPFCDWDGLSLSEMGVAASSQQWKQGQPWGNGMPWSNGQNWKSTSPEVALSSASARGDVLVSLTDTHWGHGLGIGDQIGFYPFYFGMHTVTEVFGGGVYRIWPPLRKDLPAGDFATLKPVLAMRLEGEESATAPRDASFVSGASVTLIEVLHDDVAKYFAD